MPARAAAGAAGATDGAAAGVCLAAAGGGPRSGPAAEIAHPVFCPKRAAGRAGIPGAVFAAVRASARRRTGGCGEAPRAGYLLRGGLVGRSRRTSGPSA